MDVVSVSMPLFVQYVFCCTLIRNIYAFEGINFNQRIMAGTLSITQFQVLNRPTVLHHNQIDILSMVYHW